MEAKAGQITGIVGPNGAGKSTLMKILAGEEQRDSGSIYVGDTPLDPSNQHNLIGIVHQETNLFGNLTISENLMIGRENRGLLRPKANDKHFAMLRSLGIEMYANVLVYDSPLLVQQLCEIGKALIADAELFLFDEPNSALSEKESSVLFQHMKQLRRSGKIIIFVTHRLSELVDNVDRVALIMDGTNTGYIEKEQLSEQVIAERLVSGDGVSGEQTTGQFVAQGPDRALRLRRFSHGENKFRNVDLAFCAGRVYALVGMEGSGARELLRSICMADSAVGYSDIMRGKEAVPLKAKDVVYLPASRRMSLLQIFSVRENLIARLGIPYIAYRSGWLRYEKIVSVAEEAIRTFDIKVNSPRQSISALSGGNQQKVAVAAAMLAHPVVMGLEEPARGVDLKSKFQIYKYIREFAHGGRIVLVFCTEVPEVFELADEAVIVKHGRIGGSLTVSQFGNVQQLASSIAELEYEKSSVADV